MATSGAPGSSSPSVPADRTPRQGDPTGQAPARVPHGYWRAWFGAQLESPLTSYYLILGATSALVVIGLVMVLSSSSVVSLQDTHSAYSVFMKQAMFAGLGLPLTVLAVRTPVRVWKALAWPVLVVSILAMMLVLTPLGRGVNGNRNWLVIGSIQIQPSEAAKLALVIWAAAVLSRKRALLSDLSHALVPVVVPGAVLLLGLILLGHDLGTALVLLVVVAALLWVAGAPLRLFLGAGALSAAVVSLLVVTSTSRLTRVDAWLTGKCDFQGTCWQSTHGLWALASGGWWGVGLGASREKWSWLPEAHNDYIFAIIGEELGLVGTLAVIGLFALLAFGLARVVIRSDDPFVKIATGGVLVWVLGQALLNIGTVTGILPVIGVPLPLVSSGGSALVTTMVALGMVIGFARREPGAAVALAARPGVVRRSLAVVPARVAGASRAWRAQGTGGDVEGVPGAAGGWFRRVRGAFQRESQ